MPPNERVQQVDPERLARVEQRVEDILRVMHGPPPLEKTLRDYTDSRDEHKERNLQQLVINIREKLEHDASVIREDLQEATEKNDKRHESNDARLNKLEKLAYIGIGMMMLLKLVPSDLISKLIGGH